MGLFPNFTEFTAAVYPDTVAIHGVRSGSGPPLLLLHGFPETHHMWHKIATELAAHFSVVALDLRGYGLSSKPRGTPGRHTEYSKSTMARDCATVMTGLGFTDPFFVCAHDRGARVAHKLCVDFPARVRKVILLDIAPTKTMYEGTDQYFATVYWHWFFLIQPSPFPERMILAAPEVFTEKVFGALLEVFGEELVAVYGAMFRDEQTVHAMCEDYRASSTVDIEEAREDEEEGRKVKCDLRVLWGKRGVVEAKFKPLEEWQAVCSGEVTGESVDSGHYIPEENPGVVLKNIMEFFK